MTSSQGALGGSDSSWVEFGPFEQETLRCDFTAEKSYRARDESEK